MILAWPFFTFLRAAGRGRVDFGDVGAGLAGVLGPLSAEPGTDYNVVTISN